MQDGTSFGVTVTPGSVGSLLGNLGPQQLFANSPLALLIQPRYASQLHLAAKGSYCHRHPRRRPPVIVHQLDCTYEQMPATGPEEGIVWFSARNDRKVVGRGLSGFTLSGPIADVHAAGGDVCCAPTAALPGRFVGAHKLTFVQLSCLQVILT